MMKGLLLCLVLVAVYLPYAALAMPTGNVRISGNIDARDLTIDPATIPANPTFAQLNNLASFSTSISVKDALEAHHMVFIYIFHDHTGLPRQVLIQLYVDGQEVISGTAGLAFLIGSARLNFTPSGEPTSRSTVDITAATVWTDGAAAAQINYVFDPVTFLSAANSLSATEDSSNDDCSTLVSCIGEQFPTILSACANRASSCSLAPTDLEIVPKSVADAAIASAGCDGRTFRHRAQCRTCYEHARQKVRRINSRVLFGQFLTQAITEIQSRRDATCR